VAKRVMLLQGIFSTSTCALSLMLIVKKHSGTCACCVGVGRQLARQWLHE
jgi:hypothetical protein